MLRISVFAEENAGLGMHEEMGTGADKEVAGVDGRGGTGTGPAFVDAQEIKFWARFDNGGLAGTV